MEVFARLLVSLAVDADKHVVKEAALERATPSRAAEGAVRRRRRPVERVVGGFHAAVLDYGPGLRAVAHARDDDCAVLLGKEGGAYADVFPACCHGVGLLKADVTGLAAVLVEADFKACAIGLPGEASQVENALGLYIVGGNFPGPFVVGFRGCDIVLGPVGAVAEEVAAVLLVGGVNHRLGYRALRPPARELGSHKLKVDGRAQSSLKDFHDTLAVDCHGERPANEACLFHVGHAFRVVGVLVLAGLAKVAPRVAKVRLVNVVHGREPRLKRLFGLGVLVGPEVARPDDAEGHRVPIAHSGDELQAFFFKLIQPSEVDGGEINFAGLHRCHARGNFRHLPDDELADVRCLYPVFGDGVDYAAVIRLPLADGEWA